MIRLFKCICVGFGASIVLQSFSKVLAGAYFGEVDDRPGFTELHKTKIEYVGGSVEAACALGLADGIG